MAESAHRSVFPGQVCSFVSTAVAVSVEALVDPLEGTSSSSPPPPPPFVLRSSDLANASLVVSGDDLMVVLPAKNSDGNRYSASLTGDGTNPVWLRFSLSGATAGQLVATGVHRCVPHGEVFLASEPQFNSGAATWSGTVTEPWNPFGTPAAVQPVVVEVWRCWKV